MSKQKCSTKRSFELAKQLHEQYAININERTSSFVAFVGTILALFGAFGYVFAYTAPHFADNGYFIESKSVESGVMTLEVFFLCSIITSLILCFLSLISLQLGYAGRRDQVVIDNIRKKFIPDKDERGKIFGKLYDPAGKNWYNFMPDYFNLFYWLFVSGEIAVIIFTIIKVCSTVNCSNCCSLMKWSIIILPIQLVFVAISVRTRCCYFIKYKKKKKIFQY
jgi:hypothetical protein